MDHRSIRQVRKRARTAYPVSFGAEPPQTRHGEKIPRRKLVARLQDAEEAEYQDTTHGETDGHDEQRGHKLGCCIVGAPEDGGQDQRALSQDGRLLSIRHEMRLYARTATSAPKPTVCK